MASFSEITRKKQTVCFGYEKEDHFTPETWKCTPAVCHKRTALSVQGVRERERAVSNHILCFFYVFMIKTGWEKKEFHKKVNRNVKYRETHVQ